MAPERRDPRFCDGCGSLLSGESDRMGYAWLTCACGVRVPVVRGTPPPDDGLPDVLVRRRGPRYEGPGSRAPARARAHPSGQQGRGDRPRGHE